LNEQTQAIIDRQARDWLIAVIENAMASDPDPSTPPAIDFGPCHKSKDPIIQNAIPAVEDFLNAPFQINGAGTAPLILNLDDEQRRMLNLITFLRSDLPYERARWPEMGLRVALCLIVIAVAIAYIAGPPWSAYPMKVFHGLFVLGICCIALMFYAALIMFVWHRWVSPPKPNTDENDHWPFASYEALLAERQRQQAQQSPPPIA
jgi:hypothetical protein